MRNDAAALARHDPSRAGGSVLRSAPRDRPGPEPWRPPALGAGFAVGWVLCVGALGTFTVVWLIGMVATTMFWWLGQGSLGSVLALGLAGVLVGRGWIGMARTIHGRLRRRDLSALAPLPASFWALSPELQRLVHHTRSIRIVLEDPELDGAAVDREMFEWLASIAQLPSPDQRRLAHRGLAHDQLHEALVRSRWSADRHRRPRTHRTLALGLIARFEHDVLRGSGDPFRGGGPLASAPAPSPALPSRALRLVE